MKRKTATLVVYARIHLRRLHVELFPDADDFAIAVVVVAAVVVAVAYVVVAYVVVAIVVTAVAAVVVAGVVVGIVLMKKVPCFQVVENLL